MRIKLSDIAKKAGVSVSTVSRTLNKPEMVSQSTRLRVLKIINELDYKPRVNLNKKILEYKNYMATKPNDTVLTRWGMYTHDERYRDYTASIVKMIMDDMQINEDQAYYMLYYMVSNNIDRSEEHTSELQSRPHLVCRLLLEKKKKKLN